MRPNEGFNPITPLSHIQKHEMVPLAGKAWGQHTDLAQSFGAIQRSVLINTDILDQMTFEISPRVTKNNDLNRMRLANNLKTLSNMTLPLVAFKQDFDSFATIMQDLRALNNAMHLTRNLHQARLDQLNPFIKLMNKQSGKTHQISELCKKIDAFLKKVDTYKTLVRERSNLSDIPDLTSADQSCLRRTASF